MLRIGTNIFEIGAFSSQELGINPNKDYDGIIYELREYYFHIWYLPMFTIGKKWVIYKDSEYYEIEKSYSKEAQNMGYNINNKWYANIGVILLLFAIFGYIAFDKYTVYAGKKNTALFIKEQKTTLLDRINNPKIGDYYHLDFTTSYFLNGFEVHNIANDSIQFTVEEKDNTPQPIEQKRNRESEQEKLERLVNFEKSISNEIENTLKRYQLLKIPYRFVWINKNDLLKGISNPLLMPKINPNIHFIITEIGRRNLN